MSTAAVSHKHVFGLKGDVNGNIFYLDEANLLYPAGSNIVIYNTESKTQKFVPSSESSEGITAMAASMAKKCIAIAERGEKASCIIYDVNTQRKRKTLSITDSEAKEFISVAMSADGKFLATQTGSPDWILSLWAWEKPKLLGSVKVVPPTGQTPGTLVNVAFTIALNPTDSSQVSIVGPNIFRMMRLQEGVFKNITVAKVETRSFLSQCWTTDDRLIVGTEDSKILIFESTGELKSEITYVNNMTQTFRGIYSISLVSKGFIIGCGGGSVVMYERAEEIVTTGAQVIASGNAGLQAKELYKKSKEFNLTDSSARIMCIALSPTEDTVVCSTDNCQIYAGQLSASAIKGEEERMEVLSHSFHHGLITGMDTCIRKPLIVTCASDHSVRVWNYLDSTSEMIKYFPEKAFSVAIHPSGLYILVGFSDKLRLMNLLIDDIRPFREFTIRGCKECRFSNGGQYFAATHCNSILIYSTWSFENVGHLKGHIGKIRTISWSSDDLKLISAGMDGAIYEWSLKDIGIGSNNMGKREGECVLKTCSYSCAVISPDSKTIFAVGNDKTLKEIVDSQILRELPSNIVLTQVVLSNSGKMMFCGTVNGTVRAMKFPLGFDENDYQEHQAHASPITKLRVSFDDQFLFSTSEDGCLIIYKISDKEGRVNKREKDVIYADEILVTKSDLEEKNSMMLELKARLEELKMENEYQLRLKDMNFNEKIKEVTDKFMQEIESLKVTSSVMKADREKEEIRHEEEMNDEEERHAKELLELERIQNSKLILEYEKLEDLQHKTNENQLQWESQMQDMQNAKDQALLELTTHFETKLKEKQVEHEKLQQEMQRNLKEYEEITKETEKDADQEIVEIKHKYETKLREEKEAVMRLKGENGIMKKKFNTLQTEIDTHKIEIAKMFSEEKKLHSITKSLEKDILGLKKEIQERDETIQDKEKRIYDLKKKNQELEKFKFVLDYKIKELKKQIEPREQDIQGMTSQIKEMDIELQQYNSNNSSLNLKITDLKLKVTAAEKEVETEKEKVKGCLAIVKRFKIDLNECIQHIQNPKKLKTQIKKLYHKYCKDNFKADESHDVNIQQEFARQREYLERTVASLQHKFHKDSGIHRSDNIRIMQENASLIKDINALRKETATAHNTEKLLETELKIVKAGREESSKVPKLPSIIQQ